VPTHFYKIVVNQNSTSLEAIAYLIPHREDLNSYKEYQASIDQIERATGLNFLAFLDDAQERKLESEVTNSF